MDALGLHLDLLTLRGTNEANAVVCVLACTMGTIRGWDGFDNFLPNYPKNHFPPLITHSFLYLLLQTCCSSNEVRVVLGQGLVACTKTIRSKLKSGSEKENSHIICVSYCQLILIPMYGGATKIWFSSHIHHPLHSRAAGGGSRAWEL